MHFIRTLTLVVTTVAHSSCRAEEVHNLAVENIVLTEIEASTGQKAFLANDFNYDGHIDLIVAEHSRGLIAIYVNDGAGMLTRAAEYPVGEQPIGLTAIDFCKDSITELVIVNHESDSITLLKRRISAINEMTETTRLPIATVPHSHMIAAADFDNDEVLDLIVDSRDRMGVYILRGQPEGGFDSPGRGIDVGGAPYRGFVVADVNHDDMPDIITPNQNDISVLLNRTTANLAFEKISSIPFQSPFAVGAGDANSDGNLDLIVASESDTPGIAIFTGDGNGQFTRAASVPIAAGGKIVSIGDINADGFADALITSWNNEIVLLVGRTDGPVPLRLPLGDIQNPWEATFGDFNGDGRDEAVVGDGSSGRVIIYSIKISDE